VFGWPASLTSGFFWQPGSIFNVLNCHVLLLFLSRINIFFFFTLLSYFSVMLAFYVAVRCVYQCFMNIWLSLIMVFYLHLWHCTVGVYICCLKIRSLSTVKNCSEN